jgi:hypothetical protein
MDAGIGEAAAAEGAKTAGETASLMSDAAVASEAAGVTITDASIAAMDTVVTTGVTNTALTAADAAVNVAGDAAGNAADLATKGATDGIVDTSQFGQDLGNPNALSNPTGSPTVAQPGPASNANIFGPQSPSANAPWDVSTAPPGAATSGAVTPPPSGLSFEGFSRWLDNHPTFSKVAGGLISSAVGGYGVGQMKLKQLQYDDYLKQQQNQRYSESIKGMTSNSTPGILTPPAGYTTPAGQIQAPQIQGVKKLGVG